MERTVTSCELTWAAIGPSPNNSEELLSKCLRQRPGVAGLVNRALIWSREGEHLAWVRANKLRDYEMPPADLPLIPHPVELLM